jgi:Domain of unknown function (DUF4190)
MTKHETNNEPVQPIDVPVQNIQPLGTAQAPSVPPVVMQKSGTNGMAVAGIILAFIFPLAGLIVSLIALSQIKREPQEGRGLALAGAIVSAVYMVVSLLFFIGFFWLIAWQAQQESRFRDDSQAPTLDYKNEAKERDTERQDDIKAIHGQLEAYYAQNGKYPAFEQLNDRAWRTQNLGKLLETQMTDPLGYASQLTEFGTDYTYGYDVRPLQCDNQRIDCTGYTLTSYLEDSSTYTKSALN